MAGLHKSLMPNTGNYFLTVFVYASLLIVLDNFGIHTFITLEVSLTSTLLTTYQFFKSYQRPLSKSERRALLVNIIGILAVIGVVAFTVLTLIDINRGSKSPFTGLILLLLFLYLAFVSLLNFIWLKLSSHLIDKHQTPEKILKSLVTISLTVLVIDIIANFLIHFSRQ